MLEKENLVNLIAKIGEKISIRRTHFFDNSSGLNYFYVHSSLEKNIGKIISVVKLKGLKKGEDNEFGVKIAMHIAATDPKSIDIDSLDKKLVSKEKEIFSEQLKSSGKPDDIIEKIVEGKIPSFYKDFVLNEQVFCNPEFYEGKVGTMIEELSGKLGEKIYIKKFSRIEVGA